jgi:predicted ATPase
LQPVNLLIGPNNSGKTNLLKALEFLKGFSISQDIDYVDYTFQHNYSEIIFELEGLDIKYLRKLYIAENEYKVLQTKFLNGEDISNNSFEEMLKSKHFKHFMDFWRDLQKSKIYQPNPLTFKKPASIRYSNMVDSDASNLIPFLETLRDEYREHFSKIESDLRRCVSEFYDIRFKTIEDSKIHHGTFKKWGLYSDISKMIYWADELSEGVLYFVALLCIIHQPNPPKLLLLEEPERGIHPRRIKEVVDFIFNLAQMKDIQVIMTSHHPYILNEFEDIPEAVFVFDKDEEGATQVRNLQKDIIIPSNAENDAQKLPRIKFTQDLAEHWFSGFLGGVPA